MPLAVIVDIDGTLHRHMGIGGDQIVAALGGEELYAELLPEVEPVEGARELMLALRGGGHRVVLASSAKEEEVDHYLDLLDARELVDAWTTAADEQLRQLAG